MFEKKVISLIKKNDIDSIIEYCKKYTINWNNLYKEEYLYLYLIRKCKLTTLCMDELSKNNVFSICLAMEYFIKYQPEHIVAYYLGLNPKMYLNAKNRNGQNYSIQCILNNKLLVFQCFIQKTTQWNCRDNTGKNLAMYVLRYTPMECHLLIPVDKILWNNNDMYSTSVLDYALKYSDKRLLENIFSSSMPLCIPKALWSTSWFDHAVKSYTSRHLQKTDLNMYSEKCCICLDHYIKYGEPERYISRCEHTFHLTCVKSLLKCPLCRTIL